MDAMLGLVAAAIGLSMIVTAFQIAEPKKRMISYGLAAVVTALGLYYYVSAEMRGFQMRRRIEGIQRQQQVNLEEIQKRLQESQAPAKEGAPLAPGTQSAPKAPKR
jgi:sulfite exporter TauE/SafE